ncbi:YchJ family protein [Indioceanicola profundi]|uniref:YchJ family protein n=1 Tax=Indioceanicola profundi TaxID=2220096 RepID=UPI000E6AAD97|nr:YchJ family protein [Indioceanicola profundi]
MEKCPCGSGRAFADCCGPYLAGERPAPTAEALMRSRYSAFAVQNIDYLEETLLPETRDDFDRANVTEWAKSSEWTGLEVKSTEKGREGDEEGWVEFVAHFSIGGKPHLHHESSRFAHRDGRWWYVEGIMGQRPRTAAKVGRNDPCTCGSGKKYKKCCGA